MYFISLYLFNLISNQYQRGIYPFICLPLNVVTFSIQPATKELNLNLAILV